LTKKDSSAAENELLSSFPKQGDRKKITCTISSDADEFLNEYLEYVKKSGRIATPDTAVEQALGLLKTRFDRLQSAEKKGNGATPAASQPADSSNSSQNTGAASSTTAAKK